MINLRNRRINRFIFPVTCRVLLATLCMCHAVGVSRAQSPKVVAADGVDTEESSDARDSSGVSDKELAKAATALLDSVSAESRVGASDRNSSAVSFSFDRTPWRDVIRWIADEADLALHVGELPTGSFSYSDPNMFTHQEAIDRVNLFLLPEGFTLVRSGRLLSVINLGDPRSIQQLDSLAELISVEELNDRLSHDVVKCIFPLGDIDAEDASQELAVLELMTTPKILGKTNQLLITDAVGKLRNAKKILDAFRFDELDNGTVVKSFQLQHVDAEDVLIVARPHLGLATDEMIGIDVSVSADLLGKSIFVTGVEDKVKLLEGLVEAIDRPKASLTQSGGKAQLKNYPIEGGNVETVYNVLQTLLAGKEVRLSMDAVSGSVVALASPEVQNEIAQTVQQLQASEADFEVIPLRTADPYFVISLLEEMLDLPGPLDDPEDFDADVPKIDADPGNRRLFVRAKRPQLEQIKKIVAGLDDTAVVEESSQMRIFPLRGSQAERVLESAAKFWRGDNPVVLYRALDGTDGRPTERVLNDEGTQEKVAIPRKPTLDANFQRWLTTNVHTKAAAIRCQVTPRGLLMQSDDGNALDRFEEHLRVIAGPLDSASSPPIVFYLKYAKAADAVRMLAGLLEGGEVAAEEDGGTLVNGYVSSGTGGFFGSYVSTQDGSITMTSGTVTVVADSRLNRLIAQGSASEIEEIEAYLSIIDKDNSITAIETYGTSNVIELYNTKASEVAVAIREAFAGRVEAGDSGKQAQVGGNQPRPREGEDPKAAERDRPQEKGAAKGKADAKGGGQQIRDLEPRMTVAVHEPSNSLIVTAPHQLFEQVEKLAKSIDSRAAQMVEVVTPVNGEVFETVLQQFLGQEPTRRVSTPSSSARDRAERPSPTSSKEKKK